MNRNVLLLTAVAALATVRYGYTSAESKIAFSSDRDGNWEIYVMNADGTNPVNLTNHPEGDLAPAWSPDGTKIAFSSDRDGNSEIYEIDADGSNPVNLTNNLAEDVFSSWSPIMGTTTGVETRSWGEQKANIRRLF